MLWRRAWRGIVHRLAGGGRRLPPQKRRRSRPLLEALEERWVPSNWFVSTLGSDGNPGTIAAPFATIQHAANVAASGDRIHVATGTYGYTGADKIGDDARFQQPGNPGTISGSFLHVNPAVVLVFDKSLQIYGGFDDGFTTWAPSTFRTVIDGGGVNRGVYVLDDNGAAGPGFANAALDLEGFTIQACKATGEAGLSGGDAINAYGAGMWVNDARPTVMAGVMQEPGPQGTFELKNMVFRGNLAQGNDTNDIGGSAAGAALALRNVGNMVLDAVTFDTNLSQGGRGTTRGGQAQGAVVLDHSSLTGFPVTFFQNRANGGMATGGLGSGIGEDAAGNTADAVGGGMAVLDNSTANLSEVLALSNALSGGDAPNGLAGSAYGGTFYVEGSTLRLTITDIRGGVVQGGSGSVENSLAGSGSQAGGGGVAVLNSNVLLDQVQVINNTVTGGDVGIGGAPGGGGVWITRYGSSATLSAQIINAVVADNSISYGTSNPGPNSEGGGGGGIWLQGVDATITQTTVAGNHFGNNVFLGQGIILTFGANADFRAQVATATISDSIIANHVGTASANALDLNFGNVTLDHVLYANNTRDDNSDTAFGSGYTGLNTVIRAADAGFTSPGAPNYDYSISASSPAVHQAVSSASTSTEDIEDNLRLGTPDLGAYEAPAPPRARTSVAVFDPETAIWEVRNSNASGFFPDGPIFVYGTGGGHSKPIVGDWNGDGIATVGIVEVKTLDFNGKPFLKDANGNPIPVSVFELRNSNGPGVPDIVVPYGSFAATPVAGNWDNNPQHVDHIGVVESQNGAAVWKLRNSFTRGAPDITLAYGGVTSIPVVGDWNGDGQSTIGVAENVGGLLTWKLKNTDAPGAPDITPFAYGLAAGVPIAGDWNNDGIFTPGVYTFYTAALGLWQLRNENSGGPADASAFGFGPSTGPADPYAERWIPLTGDFDGLG
jgi:hypothetical protein